MTTGRINQVSRHFERIIIYSQSQSDQHKVFAKKLVRADRPPSQETVLTSRNRVSQPLTTSTLCILPCSRCSVPNSEGNLHRTRAKNAEIRSKISKKVRYHLQSFELGPHRSNWRKKPPRTGRFFIFDANNNQKKNAVAFSMKKKPTGGQPQEKNHRRERRIGNPRTQTPIRCQRIHTEARRATPPNKSEPNRTPQIEPRWFKPLENDSILIFVFSLFYPYYFLNAAVAPCLLLHDCIF